MALGKCRECGKDVSTDAAACPHCGVKDPARARRYSGCSLFILILLILFAVGMFSRNSENPAPSTTSEQSVANMPLAARKKAIAARSIEICKAPHTAKGEKYLAKYPKWDNETIATVACGWIQIGMDSVQLRASMGAPNVINATVVQGASGTVHTHDQWVYGDMYVYVEDGVLRSWQNPRH